MATISSLGAGSGVLTQSVIDQLKASDTSAIITPINNKISTNQQQQQAVTLLQSQAMSVSTALSSLQGSSLYQNSTVSGTNTGVNVTAANGVALQNFTIANTKLATSDVVQSGSFSSSTATIATGAGKLNLNISGVNYVIPYTASTTYSDLQTAINNAAGTSVKASILQTGTSAYSLVLNSQTTGAAQQIGMTDLSGNLNSTLTTNSLKSGSFASSTSSIATGGGSLTLSAGLQTITNSDGTTSTSPVTSTFNYTATTSLSDLATMINSDPTASANVNAAVVKNDAGTYNLVLTAKGSNQSAPITLSDQASGGSLNTALTTGATTTTGTLADIQAASDASFQYNGITLTRASNTITDITAGLTINLLSSGASANIGITQDAQPIKDAMQSFVTNYNTMQAQISSMTTSTNANLVGQSSTSTSAPTTPLFLGDSSITGIDRTIKNMLTSSNSSGLSLAQYGLSINQDGTLSFDSTAFDTKMSASPDAMANFFSGQTTVDANGNSSSTDGIFTTLYNYANNLTSATGTLTTEASSLSTAATSLQTTLTSSTNSLDARYATMTSQFIAYDAIMTQMTNSFAPLLQTINQSTSSSSG